MNILIAQLVNHVNNKICELNKEQQSSWEELPQHMKEGLIKAIKDNLSPEEGHNQWMKNRLENGWTYGTTKDIQLKTSPCLIPYNQLPYQQQIKDYIRQAIIEFFKDDPDNETEVYIDNIKQPYFFKQISLRPSCFKSKLFADYSYLYQEINDGQRVVYIKTIPELYFSHTINNKIFLTKGL